MGAVETPTQRISPVLNHTVVLNGLTNNLEKIVFLHVRSSREKTHERESSGL